MNIQPSDVDRIIQTIVDGVVNGVTRLIEIAYEWYRNRTAPYYIPPPELPPNRYDEQPEAFYPEMPPLDIEEE